MPNVPPPPGGYGFPNAPKDPGPPPEVPPPAKFAAPPPSLRGGGRKLAVGFPVVGVAILCARLFLVCARASSIGDTAYTLPPPSSYALLDPTAAASPTAEATRKSADPGRYVVTADAANVYWADPEQEMVLARSKADSGASKRTLLATNEPDVTAIVATDKDVYFTRGGGGSADGALVRVSKSGDGQATVLASGLAEPVALAVEGARAFVALAGGSVLDGRIVAIDVAGDVHELVVLATGQNAPAAIAADKTHVYWTNNLAGEVMRAARPRAKSTEYGAPETFASDQTSVRLLVLDDDSVYWEHVVPIEQVVIARKSKGAPAKAAPSTVTTSPVPSLGGLAVDGKSVFFATPTYDPPVRLYRAPKAGGAAATIGAGVSARSGLVVDAKRVWWAGSEGAGSVAVDARPAAPAPQSAQEP